VSSDTLHRKEPHMILQVAESRVVGNGGCNGFSGTYQLDSKSNRLRFSPLMATKMACLEGERMKMEDQLSIQSAGNDG
jgi:heat shock protein HslJ